MNQADVQARIEKFLHEINMPGFIVFGYEQEQKDTKTKQFHIVSSFKEVPTNAAIKSLSKVLSEFADKAL